MEALRRLFGDSSRRLWGWGWVEGRESKQSLVNFAEGRPRAWLGRGPWDGPSKAAFEPIKRQEASHLQWGEKRHHGTKERGNASEGTPGVEDADLPQPHASPPDRHTHMIIFLSL